MEGNAGVKMVGSGHLWESPDFERSGMWVGDMDTGKQDIMFITSKDLVH